MPLATIDIDIDPVLHVGGLGIHWYGILYAVAFGVALYLGSVPHLERRGVDRGTVERYATWSIVAGLVGARLYYVLQSSPPQGGSWFSHPEEIPAVWHGGMAFFGAVIAVPLVLAFLAWRDGRNWWLWADAAAIFAVLGQPIGRIGNVVNGDILGYESTLPWATSYSHPDAVLQTGFVNCDPSHLAAIGRDCVAYQPAAVYEALGTLVILGILMTLRMRRNPRAGTLFILYIALYCISQFLIFFLRGSESTVALGLKQAQWTALVVGLVGVPLLLLAWRRDWLDWAPVGTETGARVGVGEETAAGDDEPVDEDEDEDEDELEEDEDDLEEAPAPPAATVPSARRPAPPAAPRVTAAPSTVVSRSRPAPAAPKPEPAVTPAPATQKPRPPVSPAPAAAKPRPPVTPAVPAPAASAPAESAARRRTSGAVPRVRRRTEPEAETPPLHTEPEAAPLAEPVFDAETEPAPDLEAEIDAGAHRDVEPEIEPEAEAEPEIEQELGPGIDAEVEPEIEAEVEPEAEVETGPAASDSEVDEEPEDGEPDETTPAAIGPRPPRPPGAPTRSGRGRRRGRGRGRGR